MSNTAQLEADLLDADLLDADFSSEMEGEMDSKADFLDDDELLIEEISIDGMCGVY